MEEAYWKQFMTTGKVEDYLQFKGVSEREKLKEKDNGSKADIRRDDLKEREIWR